MTQPVVTDQATVLIDAATLTPDEARHLGYLLFHAADLANLQHARNHSFRANQRTNNEDR